VWRFSGAKNKGRFAHSDSWISCITDIAILVRGEIMMREIHAPHVFVEELRETLTLKLRGIILDASLF
jgi:hypothetical protein